MTARTSEAKRRALLRAFAATGNQTLAVERAGVSRSTVRNLRRADPGFDSRWRAARAESAKRLAGSGCNRAPAGWARRGEGGAAMVVQRAGKRPAKLVRSSRARWTAWTEARFLGLLRQCNNARLACRRAGMTLSSYDAHLRRWPDFRRRVAEARASAGLQLEGLIEAESERRFEPDWEAIEALPVLGIGEAIRLAARNRRREGAVRRPRESGSERRGGGRGGCGARPAAD